MPENPESETVFLTFLANTFQVLQDSLDRAPAHVAIALMGTLGIVLDQPPIEVGLEGFNRFIERRPKRNPKELIQSGAVEALDEAVGLRLADLSAAMRDVIERQVEFVGRRLGPGLPCDLVKTPSMK